MLQAAFTALAREQKVPVSGARATSSATFIAKSWRSGAAWRSNNAMKFRFCFCQCPSQVPRGCGVQVVSSANQARQGGRDRLNVNAYTRPFLRRPKCLGTGFWYEGNNVAHRAPRAGHAVGCSHAAIRPSLRSFQPRRPSRHFSRPAALWRSSVSSSAR